MREINILGGQTGRFLEYRRAGLLKYIKQE
jgi:hypothetical protein